MKLYLLYQFLINHSIHVLSLWILLYGSVTTLVSNSNQTTSYCSLYLIILMIVFIIELFIESQQKEYLAVMKIVHQCIMTIALPILFLSTTEMIKTMRSQLYDNQLQIIDEIVFPFFEKGQVALEVDKNEYFNPSTFHGRLLNDYFEIIYISFYIWGYLSFGICAFDVFVQWIKNYHYFHHEMNSEENRENGYISELNYNISSLKQKIINMEYLVILWVTTFSFVFILNLLFPGKSPRIHLSKEFKNEIEGFGFTSWWKSHVDRDDSAGTFPSGHCGETFAVAFGIYYSHKTLGKIVFIMASLITLSTLWNRYHYIIDLVIGIICCLCGYIGANLYLKEKMKQ